MVPSIPVFAYLLYLNLSSGTGGYPAYTISNVNESGYRLVQKTVIGNTVERLTSYIDEYEYTLTIDVTQNNDTDSTDSYLMVECFLADTYVYQVLVPLFNVASNSDRTFTYSFPLVVEKTGSYGFCISTQSEITQLTRQERYRQIMANQVIYLRAPN
jgi:hypothetical protein